jgi:hypothetical protein
VLKAHVASACFKCFRHFRSMLQVFQMNVAKVDRDVAYVVVVCTHMLQAFVSNVSSIFQTCVASIWYLDVAYVSHIRCKYFI